MTPDPTAFTPMPEVEDCTTLGLVANADYQYAAAWTEIPVHRDDLEALVPVFPIALCPGEDAPWPVVGISGVTAATNVLVGPKGGWAAATVPELVTTYPFLARSAANGQGVVCIDLDGPRVNRHMGEALFEPDGTPTALFNANRDAAARQLRQRNALAQAVAALAGADLLAPWSPNDVDTVEPERHYYVDRQALARLDDHAAARLHQAGALSLAFAQRHSLANMRKLRFMDQRRRASLGDVAPMLMPDDEMPFDWSALDD